MRYYYVHCAAALAALLLSMIPLSKTSGQSLNNSGQHLRTWETLSGKFEAALQAHERTLTELSARLSTSESNGERLTSLCGQLSEQNESLKVYNTQIAERMQERDEDLAKAYRSIDTLKKQRIKITVAFIIAAGLAVIEAVVFFIIVKR